MMNEEQKEHQLQLVEDLRSGKMAYKDAPIYTVILDLLKHNQADDVYYIFKEVFEDLKCQIINDSEFSSPKMSHEEKVKYMAIAAGVCGFGFTPMHMDLLVRLYELVQENKGDTNIDNILFVKEQVKMDYNHEGTKKI